MAYPKGKSKKENDNDAKRNPLVSGLTDLVAETCGIKPNRIFVVLADIQPSFWSWNGATIG